MSFSYDLCLSDHHLLLLYHLTAKDLNENQLCLPKQLVPNQHITKCFPSSFVAFYEMFVVLMTYKWALEHLYQQTLWGIILRKIRTNCKPWINGNIRKKMNKRCRLLQKDKKTAKGLYQDSKKKKSTNFVRNAVSNF